MNDVDAQTFLSQIRAALDTVGLPDGYRVLVIVEHDKDGDVQQVMACSAAIEMLDMLERAVDSVLHLDDAKPLPGVS